MLELLNAETLKIISETGLSTLLALLYFTEIRQMKKKLWDVFSKIEYIEKAVDRKDTSIDDAIKINSLLNKK